jgi:mono/diheme cytochrome c family protein
MAASLAATGVSARFAKGAKLAAKFPIIVVMFLAGLSICTAQGSEPNGPKDQGRALAERLCARCHAIGKSGKSPHLGAPPFRELSRRVDLDTFTDRLREGLASGHPDMPTFRFSPADARALTAYLLSIQGP